MFRAFPYAGVAAPLAGFARGDIPVEKRDELPGGPELLGQLRAERPHLREVERARGAAEEGRHRLVPLAPRQPVQLMEGLPESLVRFGVRGVNGEIHAHDNIAASRNGKMSRPVKAGSYRSAATEPGALYMHAQIRAEKPSSIAAAAITSRTCGAPTR
jgi:hypothetical protein